MFTCELCEKQYAYVHKLRHHELWLCKGRTSESVMLSSPRRSGSRNCFSLPPTPDKGEGEVEKNEELSCPSVESGELESGELESEVVESGEQDKAKGEVSRGLNVTHIFILLPFTEFPLLLM